MERALRSPLMLRFVQETPELCLAIWPRRQLFIEPPPADHDARLAEHETTAAKEKHDDVPERTRFDERAPIPTVGKGEKPPVAALPQVIFAQRLALESVLGNLITNASRAIFEPFWRKENTTTGTGLGLSIAREIIGKLGGKLDRGNIGLRRYVQDSASQFKARAHRSFGMLRPSMMH
ncbi:hypothetical protein [Methylocystis iwaonis]|uniref:hypothetical protein n=1 Tax=Methylocystis iwaonis TaxID=2885079 RepID=UPI002492B269|nr:hypothetical protein [Methylocystis iwaonis]